MSVLFSGNIWIQISPTMPFDRIQKICKIAKVKYGIYDRSFGNDKSLKKLKIKIFDLETISKRDDQLKISIPKNKTT